jgi:hypothetical protein
MFGRPAAFSSLVTQFDAKIAQLTWNDGQTIHALTALAKQATPADIDVVTACVVFRILMNPPKSKLPVIYLMDSITKNSGPAYVESFSLYISELYPAIYQLVEAMDLRNAMQKLLTVWTSRQAFHSTILERIQSKIDHFNERNAQVPPLSDWPSLIPPAVAQLPAIEASIVQFLYKNIMPLERPTPDQLLYNRDAVVSLSKLLLPLNTKLGRPHDPEVDKLIHEYDKIEAMRIQLQNEPLTNGTEVISPPPGPLPMPPEIHHPIPAPIDPNHMHPKQQHIQAHEELPTRPSSSKPSVSDPRTLSNYFQPNIDMLYKNMTHRCATCGLRFKTNEELAAHLDWHYFERTSHLGRQSGRGVKLQRQWYISAKEWIETNGGTTGQVKQEKTDATSQQATGEGESQKQIVRISDAEHEDQAICGACGDEIDQPEYDDSGWFYPNTIRSSDGTLYHAKCAPQQVVSLASSSSALHNSNDASSPSKKRSHPEDDTFDELMVSPDAKRAKIQEDSS